MYIKALPLGPVAANCYILCDDSKCGAVIDVGDYNPALEIAIKESGIEKLLYIICTHGHFDHVSGVSRLKQKHPEAKVVVGEADAPALSSAFISGAETFGLPFYPCYADVTVNDGDVLQVGSTLLKVIATPGHTLGGVVLYCEKEKVAFTGDTLFRGSVGRTDLFGGSYTQLMTSIKKITKLPPDTTLLCGHGAGTKVEFELEHNPYI
jgi:glyoxylase-like metal-dependent hydrolase (beta-lactamase superfamily II)